MYTITVSRSSLLTIRPYNVLGRTKYTNTITHRHEDVRDRRLPVTCKVLSYWRAARRTAQGPDRSLIYLHSVARSQDTLVYYFHKLFGKPGQDLPTCLCSTVRYSLLVYVAVPCTHNTIFTYSRHIHSRLDSWYLTNYQSNGIFSFDILHCWIALMSYTVLFN